MRNSTIAIAGATLEMFESGAGAPMLFLHGCDGFDPAHRYAAKLSVKARGCPYTCAADAAKRGKSEIVSFHIWCQIESMPGT